MPDARTVTLQTRQAGRSGNDWRRTSWWRIVRMLGSIRLAIPFLIAAAAAMIRGTYLESTKDAETAKALVYGSWWFIALMSMICVSLVFAVIARFPWRRKHIGFIIVHASLITLIIGGFISLYHRSEGTLTLQEGETGSVMMTGRYLVSYQHPGADPAGPKAAALVRSHQRHLTLAETRLPIVDRWKNAQQTLAVTNDNPARNDMFRLAVALGTPHEESVWVGPDQPAGGAQVTIRVLRPDQKWIPAPEPDSEEPRAHFVLEGRRYPVGDTGTEAVPGWTIDRVQYFTSATLTADAQVTENEGGPPNPAVQVILTDGQGSRERHTAFARMPDMPFARTIEGPAVSGATLVMTDPSASEYVLQAIDAPEPGFRAAYTGPEGFVEETFPANRAAPWALDIGPHGIVVLDHETHARTELRWTEAPEADRSVPVLVVRDAAGKETYLAWGRPTTVDLGSAQVIATYGPDVVALPFAIRLDDFRKMDYPGSSMAMAYESDVTVTYHSGPRQGQTDRLKVHMNHPLKYDDWKVYQSSFQGQTISTFSIMKDPGLTTTYAACIGLCIGIAVIFYFRSFSHGHPGIPAPIGTSKKQRRILRGAPRKPAELRA